MSKMEIPATSIENWFFMNGRVGGWVDKKQVVTSQVYSLRGNFLTTLSGSTYLLSEKTDGNNEWDKLEKFIQDSNK